MVQVYLFRLVQEAAQHVYHRGIVISARRWWESLEKKDGEEEFEEEEEEEMEELSEEVRNMTYTY